MPPAATLAEAAGLAYDNLAIKWQLPNQFELSLVAFVEELAADFPDENVNNRPIGNWLAKITAFLADGAPFAAGGNINDLNTAAQFLYRICWCGSALATQGLITGAQATEMLTQYNASFA